MDDTKIEMDANKMFSDKVYDTLKRENFKNKKMNNEFINFFNRHIENLGLYGFEKLMVSYNAIIENYKEWYKENYENI